MVSWRISPDPPVSDEEPEKPAHLLHFIVSPFVRQPERNHALAERSPAPFATCSFSQKGLIRQHSWFSSV